MIVSHFELIYKLQAPATVTGVPALDKVVQGYFLEITNLETKAIRFLLEFVVLAVPNAPRSLAGNTLVFVDTPGVDNQGGVLTGSLTSTVFTPSTGFINIPAGATALVAVLPSVFRGVPFDLTPITEANFEVRGYVRLRVPPVILRPQSATPVKVLLTPQNRATFFKADGTISGQVQASLPLAQGKAEVAIEAESLFIVKPPINLNLERLIGSSFLESVGENRAEMLAMLLASLDPEQDDISAFNKALADAGIGVAVERRKVKDSE